MLPPSAEGSYGHVQVAPLVAPEKISFGINTRCSFYTTVKGIKDSCGEVDGRLVAKEVSPLHHLVHRKIRDVAFLREKVLVLMRHGCLPCI